MAKERKREESKVTLCRLIATSCLTVHDPDILSTSSTTTPAFCHPPPSPFSSRSPHQSTLAMSLLRNAARRLGLGKYKYYKGSDLEGASFLCIAWRTSADFLDIIATFGLSREQLL